MSCQNIVDYQKILVSLGGPQCKSVFPEKQTARAVRRNTSKFVIIVKTSWFEGLISSFQVLQAASTNGRLACPTPPEQTS